MSDLLFLNPNKHPYTALNHKGKQLGRFSNLACAAQTVVSKRKGGGSVVTPDGNVIDYTQCITVVGAWQLVKSYMKREVTGMVA